jgi:hypothetical protein
MTGNGYLLGLKHSLMDQLHATDAYAKILADLKAARLCCAESGFRTVSNRLEFYAREIARLVELGPEGIMREFDGAIAVGPARHLLT